VIGGHLHLTNRPDGTAIDVEVMKRRSWPGITAQYVRISAPTTFDFKVDSSVNYIALYDLYRADGETCASGIARSFSKDLHNKLTYSPSGSELEGWCEIDRVGSIAAVTIDPAIACRRPIDLSRIPAQVEFEDEVLRSVLLRFRAILDDPSLDIPGYAETLAELLTFELNRASKNQAYCDEVQGGKLTAAQLQIVMDYITEHLSQKIAIAQLATLIGMTRFHFIRSFKNSVGRPPHQYIIRRRTDHARDLLETHSVSIAEAAERSGFGSAFHMTRTFRRILGTTATAARQDKVGRRASS
jgi:AraC family transcriptional regulator